MAADPEFFVCIRAQSGRGKRAYPVVKLPDGTIREVTWEEARCRVLAEASALGQSTILVTK